MADDLKPNSRLNRFIERNHLKLMQYCKSDNLLLLAFVPVRDFKWSMYDLESYAFWMKGLSTQTATKRALQEIVSENPKYG